MVLILAMKRVFDLGSTTLLLTVATRENIWCNWRRWCLPYIQVPASHGARLGRPGCLILPRPLSEARPMSRALCLQSLHEMSL